MVQEVSGHRNCYLVAREGRNVRGVLPLTHVRSLLFGNRLVSQAFANYGGPLGGPDAVDALYHASVELARQRRCRSIEFRNIDTLPFDLDVRTDKVSMRLALMEDPDALWNSFSKDSGVRKMVRKAEKNGISVVDGGAELLNEFYSLYVIRMRQLGTPCYSMRVMRGFLDFFPDNTRGFLARLGGKTIAGKLMLRFKGQVEAFYSSSLLEYNTMGTNHLLHWTAMQHYCRVGVTSFDFGRSTIGGGPYEFKRKWGAEEIPLHWQYWSDAGHKVEKLSPDNPKYQKRIELWRKMPLWLTRLAGPVISRGLP
jgi:FemAB-related protein (PEP-CTERM system-associated)